MMRLVKECMMRKLFDMAKKERGASIVEYSVLLALFALVAVPAMGGATSAASDALDESVAHFAYTGDGGGSPTTTVPSSTTTTTVPPTTTTSSTSTTTTTVPPTTTTTTLPVANQTKSAAYLDEISVTFWETDGVVTFGDVEADGWTYKVTNATKDDDRKQTLKFTNTTSGKVVFIRGKLNTNDVLKTKVWEQ